MKCLLPESLEATDGNTRDTVTFECDVCKMNGYIKSELKAQYSAKMDVSESVGSVEMIQAGSNSQGQSTTENRCASDKVGTAGSEGTIMI